LDSDYSWCRRTGEGWQISIHAQPGAKKNEVVGAHGDALKIRIASPPVDGRANEALIAYLATLLDMPRAEVSLLRGESSRRKVIFISSTDFDPARLLAPKR
jgi:hypothetical protein